MKLMQRLRGEMETDRLLLRRWKPGDLPDFIKFDSDPAVMAAAGAKPAMTLEAAETDFHRAMRDGNCYAIVLKQTGEAVGKIKFQTDFRRPGVNSLSIGYELRRDLWGNGYMPEALCAMIVCAFEKRKADVVAISHFTVNQRSRRVIEKCGFRREGTILRAFLRYDGTMFDDECYSILKEEYFADPGRWSGGAEKPPLPDRLPAKTPRTSAAEKDRR